MPSVLEKAKRLVVKVGSSLVTDQGRGLDLAALSRWAEQIAQLRQAGREVVLVSSGAIAAGMQRLGWDKRPHALHELQAAAAVGQMSLVQAYETCFRKHRLLTSQILLTHEDLADRKRYLNARSTLRTLLALGVVPIINENDTVAIDEIRFGDNQAGLYDRDPRKDSAAMLVTEARADDPALEGMAGGSGTHIGLGGMITKVLAARRAARGGAHTIIASGHENDVLPRLARGERIGTQLTAERATLAARKQWLADHLQVRGNLTLDAGAVKALTEQGKSLLPIGVIGVGGEFERGEVVSCLDESRREIARGLVNYGAADARRILRAPSGEIEARLGYVDEPELIHRDNLVLL
jgi:glutamate 5-kinase